MIQSKMKSSWTAKFCKQNIFGLNNILFTVTLTYYDIYILTIFLGFDGKC